MFKEDAINLTTQHLLHTYLLVRFSLSINFSCLTTITTEKQRMKRIEHRPNFFFERKKPIAIIITNYRLNLNMLFSVQFCQQQQQQIRSMNWP